MKIEGGKQSTQLRFRWTLSMCLSLALFAGLGRGNDWPQFRGPNSSGLAAESSSPDQWGKDNNVLWKIDLPGFGWSSPIVWGDKVFVTTAVSDRQTKPSGGFGGRGGFGRDRQAPDSVYRWEVCCLNAADGKVLWKQVAAEQKPTIPIQASNTYASETPVTDGERVYAYFGMTGVFCYDFAGKLVWKADLGSYRMAMGYGTGSSPALDGDRLFVQCDNEEKSFLVALDKKTGKELWRVDRPERSGWSTPLVWKNKDRTEVVCLGSPRVRSYDPATGKQLWELGGMNGMCHASPVAGDDLLYVGTGGGPGFGRGRFGGPRESGGGGRPLVAVKAGAAGDLTLKEGATSNDGIAWSQPQAGPPMSSPLLYKGYLYVPDQHGGLLSCYDAKTGKQVYRERLPGARGFTSSPWACEGKVFCLADDGQTFVVQAGPEFKLVGQNKIDEMCWSSPALAGGALFLRTVDHLYCIKKS